MKKPYNLCFSLLRSVVFLICFLFTYYAFSNNTPILGNEIELSCPLIVDCSNITDQQLACRDDIPPVDFSLPVVIDSCGDVSFSALTIIPGSSACPGDTLFVTRTYFINDGATSEECMQTFTIVDDIVM